MSPALEAHLRLLSQLPIRKHEARTPFTEAPRSIPRIIKMRGQIFNGFRECAQTLRVAYKTIYKEAEFLEE